MKRPIGRRVTGLLATAAAVLGGALVAPTQAHAAWGTTYDISIQVSYQYPTGTTVQLGHADGWVQFDDGGNSFRYSLTVSQQSGYTTPNLEIAVNAGWVGQNWEQTGLDYLTLPGGTSTTTGEYSYANFSNVEFVLYGDTFTPSYVTVTKKSVLTNPY